MAQWWVQRALVFLAALRGWPEVGEAVQEFVCSVLYHIAHRRCSVAVSFKGQNQMFALVPGRFAQGLEEQRSLPKRGREGTPTCAFCEWRLGSALAIRTASPAPVGLRECIFKTKRMSFEEEHFFSGRGFVCCPMCVHPAPPCLQQGDDYLHNE